MVDLELNGSPLRVRSAEELSAALEHCDAEPLFELWASIPEGPSLCMLRNGDNAWLMYLRYSADSGFSSRGDTARSGTVEFRLSNGQVDEYPLAWCVDREQCYKAIAYFFANAGGCPAGINWHDDANGPS